MRNLSGFSGKIRLLSSVFLALISLLFAHSTDKVYANDIESSLSAHYSLNNSGDLNVSLKFGLTNTGVIPAVVNYYTVTIPFTGVDDLIVTSSGKTFSRTIHNQSMGSDVVINFENLVIPRGGTAEFTSSFVKKAHTNTDNIASLILPAEFNGIDSVEIIVDYPKQWGKVSWVSTPEYEQVTAENNQRVLAKSVQSKTLNLLLGDSPSYIFEISKQLINTDNQRKIFDISVPLWSSNQRITFQAVEPLPNSVVKDIEGNLTLKYILEPEESKLVKIKGHISLPEERSEDLDIKDLDYAVKNIEYWKLDSDTEYKRVALYQQNNGLTVGSEAGAFGNLKSREERGRFVLNSYSYVIGRLSTESLLSSSFESPLRAGASVALTKRSYAVPEDYADLLISILRYYGVPSRMIVGYVTEQSGYRTGGFFHSWVEYWNVDSKEWKVLDPSLDDLVSEDLLNMDLRERVSFILRSRSSTLPKLTYFSTEEFTVKPSISTIEPHTSSKAEFIISDSDIARRYVSGNLKVTNTGNTAFSLSDIRFIKDSETLKHSTIFNYEGLVVLPGMSIEVPLVLEEVDSVDSMEKEISIEYRATPPNSSSIIELSSLIISFEKRWWWDWMVKLISTIIFLSIVSISYFIFKKFRNLWT